MTTNIESVQTFKILIIGDSNVGKSSLMTRFVHGIFSPQYTATIGVDFQIAIVQIGEYKCRLQIWDTAGQERFRSITSTYYRGADGIIIVYDVTNTTTFANIKVRISEIEYYCGTSIPKILVGNKDDSNNAIKKVVLTSDACQYAEQNKLTFFEISVKENRNIHEVFNEITKLVLKRRLDQSENSRNNIYTTRFERNSMIENDTNKRCCTA